jgi:predicted MFS family arabinose efflux permease
MDKKAIAKSPAAILPYAWVILIAVYLASIVAPLNQFKVPPILPVLMEQFQINLTQAGGLMSIIAFTGLLLALPAGIILQRSGPKFTGLIALGCMAAGAALGALSSSYGGLMGSRVVEGIGMGLIGVVAPATIAMWFPPARQGMPMGIWATWVPVGTVLMYNLAPTLTAAFGWQAVWWADALFALANMLIYGLLVRRPEQQETASPQQDEGTSGLRQALANRDIWLLALEFACFNLALVALGTYYPTFLNEVRGYPLGPAAFISSLATLLILVSAPAAGWLSDRINSRRLVFSLPFLALAALFVFPFRVTGWQLTALMVAQGLMAGAIPTATFAAAPELMRRPEWGGLGLAVVLIGQNLGQLVGPLLFGQFVNSLGWLAAGYLMIPVCLLGFISAWKVRIR